MKHSRSWVANLVLLSAATLLSLAACELVLRYVFDVEPLGYFVPNVTKRPETKPFFVRDAEAGYTLNPGRFVLTFGDHTGCTVIASHNEKGRRITKMVPKRNAGRHIWIFGCSFTYGWSLNDYETYPWLIQSRFPDHDVQNFGVAGYGTLNSLRRYEEAITSEVEPDIVVLAYSPFMHGMRDTASRAFRLWTQGFSEIFGQRGRPFARLGPDAELQFGFLDTEYRSIPLSSRLSTLALVERSYNEIHDRSLRNQAVAERLVLEFGKKVLKRNGRFIIASIHGGEERLRVFRDAGLETVAMAVPKAARFKNLPCDGHPNAHANRLYAKTLGEYLRATQPAGDGRVDASHRQGTNPGT